jgi:hypothetical protein
MKQGFDFYRVEEKVMDFAGFGEEKTSSEVQTKSAKTLEKKTWTKKNCNKPHRSRGLCFAHLRKFKTSGATKEASA